MSFSLSTSSDLDRTSRLVNGIGLLMLVIILAFVTHHNIGGANDASRIATIESLVERHTWSIDGSVHAGPDRVYWEGHYYSSKPPVLAAMGAFFYAPLRAFGWELDTVPGVPETAYFLITFFLMGGSLVLAVIFFYRSFEPFGVPWQWRTFLSACLVYGTLLFPYATTFNNHLPAAAALMGAWYVLVTRTSFDHARIPASFWCGVWVSLAAVIDPFSALFCVVGCSVFWLLFPDRRGSLFWYIGGGLLPFIIHALFNYSMSGTIIPFYLIPEAYYFPGAYWLHPMGIDILSHSRVLYAFNTLVGTHGIFLYTPLYVCSFFALINTWRTQVLWRRERGTLVCIVFLLLMYIIMRTNSYGGHAYGLRWYVALAPLLLWPLGFAYTWVFDAYVWRRRFFMLAVFFSVAFAVIGIVNPWSNVHYRSANGTVIYFPLLGNVVQLLSRMGIDAERFFL